MARTLVKTDGLVVALRGINVHTEPHDIGRGMEVVDCTTVIDATQMRDMNIWSNQLTRLE